MTDQNNPEENNPQPEIPSFKQTKEDEKKGGGFSLFGKGGGPRQLLRVRGLGGASILERLKQFRKKDLAFIASGIGVLLLAPLAEHYILGPGEEQKTLTQGFDQKGNAFSDAAGNVYEPGAGGFAPGGLPGQGSDVITPLNVRDPAALVMGPGATQQPPTSAPAQPAKESKEDWKEALSSAGRSAARAAEPAPFSKGTLAGSIRGLSALSGASGGGGPSYNLPAPSAGNVPNRAGGGGSLSRVQAAPGFQGAAGHANSQGSGGADALKRAADSAANQFNRAGSAAGALQSAANQSIPGGGRSDELGGPGGGSSDKAPGGNSTKDNKSLGESLAFMKAKMEMEKAIELKWKKIEWNQFEKQKMMQEALIKMGLDLFKDNVAKKAIESWANLFPTNDNKPIWCESTEKGNQIAGWGTDSILVTFPNADAKKACENGEKSKENSSNKDAGGKDCNNYMTWDAKLPGHFWHCTDKRFPKDGSNSSPTDTPSGGSSGFSGSESLDAGQIERLNAEIKKGVAYTGDALDEINKANNANNGDKKSDDKSAQQTQQAANPAQDEIKQRVTNLLQGVQSIFVNTLPGMVERLRGADTQLNNAKKNAQDSAGFDKDAYDSVNALVKLEQDKLGDWLKTKSSKGDGNPINPKDAKAIADDMNAINGAEEKVSKVLMDHPHASGCDNGLNLCITQVSTAKGAIDEAGKLLEEAREFLRKAKEGNTTAAKIRGVELDAKNLDKSLLTGLNKTDIALDQLRTTVELAQRIQEKMDGDQDLGKRAVHQMDIADQNAFVAEQRVTQKGSDSDFPLVTAVSKSITKGDLFDSATSFLDKRIGDNERADGKTLKIVATARDTLKSAQNLIGQDGDQSHTTQTAQAPK